MKEGIKGLEAFEMLMICSKGWRKPAGWISGQQNRYYKLCEKISLMGIIQSQQRKKWLGLHKEGELPSKDYNREKKVGEKTE